MVSPQILLALGVGLPLLAIGGYVAWLSRRVSALEERADREEGAGPEGAESRTRPTGDASEGPR